MPKTCFSLLILSSESVISKWVFSSWSSSSSSFEIVKDCPITDILCSLSSSDSNTKGVSILLSGCSVSASLTKGVSILLSGTSLSSSLTKGVSNLLSGTTPSSSLTKGVSFWLSGCSLSSSFLAISELFTYPIIVIALYPSFACPSAMSSPPSFLFSASLLSSSLVSSPLCSSASVFAASCCFTIFFSSSSLLSDLVSPSLSFSILFSSFSICLVSFPFMSTHNVNLRDGFDRLNGIPLLAVCFVLWGCGSFSFSFFTYCSWELTQSASSSSIVTGSDKSGSSASSSFLLLAIFSFISFNVPLVVRPVPRPLTLEECPPLPLPLPFAAPYVFSLTAFCTEGNLIPLQIQKRK